MIIVRITEAELVARRACDDGHTSGMALFREIAAGRDFVEVEWTPLAAVWLAVGAPGFCGWLRERGLIPVAQLQYADLQSAYLQRANLRGADLQRANLRGAQLQGADLQRADLQDADLRGAYRSAQDPATLGWVVVEGRMEKA